MALKTKDECKRAFQNGPRIWQGTRSFQSWQMVLLCWGWRRDAPVRIHAESCCCVIIKHYIKPFDASSGNQLSFLGFPATSPLI